MGEFRRPRDLIEQRREKRWILPALVAVLVGAVLFTNRGNSDDGTKLGLVDQVQPVGEAAELDTGPVVGKLAPNFRLEQPEGEAVLLSDLRGRPVVLLFWRAGGCPACPTDLLNLQTIADRYGNEVVVFGVAVDEPAERVTTVVEGLAIGYPQLLDSGRDVARAYSVETMPVTVIVDGDGVVVSIDARSMSVAELAAQLPVQANATPSP